MITDLDKRIDRAEKNLQRKLEWISRVDTRVSFIAGVAIAMLGVLANAFSRIICWEWYHYAVFYSAAAFLFVSLFYLYKSQNPKILAPNESLIFFGTIAKMKFDDFKSKFSNTSPEDYFDDLLHQVHINSEILCEKFYYLKSSITWIIIAVIPWLIALYFAGLY
ncbi:MAG: hypothetical protein BGO70_01075 [Bacteroidetes bacterium 43-93]|uniref:Pycsar system effector family protein n=1 Tax=uncultured Dysgonomonas sp. TaxID=206096 RepID=UPI0009277AB5|nr:Pycsar system effector family protein [uncultured Dysgonomonas sp.]MBN9483129.1 hypothetical protein [Bacteroidota bacterium]OJW96304.1 MAG: hypothetical protein BGO70_01075 [Bacteroidetes bacterium 43-93]